jgi:hypothetical protein
MKSKILTKEELIKALMGAEWMTREDAIRILDHFPYTPELSGELCIYILGACILVFTEHIKVPYLTKDHIIERMIELIESSLKKGSSNN